MKFDAFTVCILLLVYLSLLIAISLLFSYI